MNNTSQYFAYFVVLLSIRSINFDLNTRFLESMFKSTNVFYYSSQFTILIVQ